MVRAFLVALALLGATSSAMAAATSATSSGAGCRTANERSVIDKVDAGFCSGIVEGTMWSLQIAKLVCLPNGMTLGQGLKVLVKYMDDHPEALHEKTAELAARAFVKAWPCSHDSESVRKHHLGLHSFRSMRRIDASLRKVSALRLRHSQSLASLRHLPSQAKVRSTIQRLGKTTKRWA